MEYNSDAKMGVVGIVGEVDLFVESLYFHRVDLNSKTFSSSPIKSCDWCFGDVGNYNLLPLGGKLVPLEPGVYTISRYTKNHGGYRKTTYSFCNGMPVFEVKAGTVTYVKHPRETEVGFEEFSAFIKENTGIEAEVIPAKILAIIKPIGKKSKHCGPTNGGKFELVGS